MPYYTRNVIILSTAIFLAAFSWNQVVPFLPLFLKQLGAGENVVSWSYAIFICQALAGLIAQPIWGKIGDTVGRKPMVLRAGVCLVAIYFGMSVCTAPWQVAIFRFLNGALTGFIPSSMALVATNTPEKNAAGYVATTQTAAAAGLIMGPAIGWILADALGIRTSMHVSGSAVLLSTLLVWWLVKEPNKATPEEKTSLFQDFHMAIRSPVLGSMMFAVMVVMFFNSAINPVLALHMGKLDGSAPSWLPGVIFSLPAVAMVLFAHRWTRIGELWAYNKVIVLGLACGGIGGLALALVYNIWLFAAVYFAAGIFMAAVMPTVGAVICVDVEESFRGRAFGMRQAAGMLGALLAFAVGLYVGTAFGIRAIFLLAGSVLAAGAPIYYLIARRRSKANQRTNVQ